MNVDDYLIEQTLHYDIQNRWRYSPSVVETTFHNIWYGLENTLKYYV